MLPYSEWLDIAQALRLGQSRRVQHCGNSTSMKVTHDDEGLSAYCFRCSEHGFKSHGIRRLSDVFAEREFIKQGVQLPLDYTQVIPTIPATWLYKSGVSAPIAASYGVGWSERMRRVILPVYAGSGWSDLAVIQARAVDAGHMPKYLNQEGVGKGGVLFVAHRAREVPSCTSVVITEDILSAIRVDGAGVPAVSTLGTKLSDAQAGLLMQYDEIIIWLDPDEAGLTGAMKMRRKLMGCKKVRIVQSTHDPKEYCNEQILQHLT